MPRQVLGRVHVQKWAPLEEVEDAQWRMPEGCGPPSTSDSPRQGAVRVDTAFPDCLDGDEGISPGSVILALYSALARSPSYPTSHFLQQSAPLINICSYFYRSTGRTPEDVSLVSSSSNVFTVSIDDSGERSGACLCLGSQTIFFFQSASNRTVTVMIGQSFVLIDFIRKTLILITQIACAKGRLFESLANLFFESLIKEPQRVEPPKRSSR